MSRTPGKLAKLNLPLMALWVASVAVAVIGYLLMTLSNANQAKLYTSQTGDYGQLFAAQSGSTVGGLLIAVGVLGVLLALAAHAIGRTKAVTQAPEPVAVSDEELAFVNEEPAEETGAPVTASVSPAPAC